MFSKQGIHNLIRAAGLVAGLVILQQLIAYTLFSLTFNWNTIPQLMLVNFGIVAGWYYFKDPDRKIPAFLVMIAAFCFAIWLRAVLIYIGLFRLIATLVISFLEKQFAYVIAFINMPQLIPTLLAALILLLILPKAKDAYRRIISNGNY